MRVLYDYQAFYRDRVGGISRYFSEIIRHMPEEIHTETVAATSCNIYMQGQLKALNINCSPKHRFRSKALRLINQAWVGQRMKKGGFDVFHPTDFDPYYIPSVKTPVVATIHDMYWEMSRSNQSMIDQRNRQINHANHIITVSEQTRRDLLEFYPKIDPGKVSTIHHGFTPIVVGEEAPIMKQPYLLFIGKRSGYKNFGTLLKAFAQLAQHNHELSLVCTGTPFANDERQVIDRLRLTNRVHQLFATDLQLYNLYAHALCFVYPSQYEGFGIPILEAWGSKCPVLLSKASCFPEIGGEAVDYFETNEVESLVSALTMLINDETHRNELITLGTERLRCFSWEKAASKTMEIYKTLC